MLGRMRAGLTYSNVMATTAVFIALSASGYAAVKINGKDLEARSVAASKIKRNALTGTEIREARLGEVPRAKAAAVATSAGRADRAGVADRALSAEKAATAQSAETAQSATTAQSANTADRLDGLDSTAFEPVHEAVRIDRTLPPDLNALPELARTGHVVWSASCSFVNGDEPVATLFVDAAVPVYVAGRAVYLGATALTEEIRHVPLAAEGGRLDRDGSSHAVGHLGVLDGSAMYRYELVGLDQQSGRANDCRVVGRIERIS